MKGVRYIVMVTVTWILLSGTAKAQPAFMRESEPTQSPMTHDPVMAKHQDTYYLFSTGRGISVRSSKDMISWKRESPVFSEPPAWAIEAVPGFKGHIWAPDISYHDGLYYLYYSISTFGKNTSCIGLATNKTLDPASPDFKWTDHGKIIESSPGKTNWNAIDPNLIEDDQGNAFLSFGSFWGGLKLAKLSKDRKSLAQDIADLPTIASRVPASGPNPIEAPFIVKKGGYYYLFASIDYCCKGVESTYKMIVGRAKDVVGPYLDNQGTSLANGGGTILLAGNQDWNGVGHNSVYTFDGVDYLVFHGYDANDDGRAKLRIETLRWDDAGWPVIE